ncbi:MAG: hypothetical protein JKY51_04605 [Opitutaceae bacterium]|nr:hypothetical protein [Opitutaceae bacterium]
MKTNLTLFSNLLLFSGAFFVPIFSYSGEAAKSNEAIEVSHAYIPVALYGNKFHPIVGVENKKPLINVSGQLVPVSKETTVFFWANRLVGIPDISMGRNVATADTGVGHGLTSANFANTSLGGTSDSVMSEEGGEVVIKHDDTTSLWEDVTPLETPLINAYGVFVFYSEKGVAELHWRNLKDTTVGEKLSVRVPYLNKKTLKTHKDPRYLLLVYQSEAELTPANNPQREDLLKWFEKSSMAQIAGSYLNAQKDKKANPALLFRPDFDLKETDYKNLSGRKISVEIVISEIGMVSEANLDTDIPDSTANKILDTVRCWKFFPAIEEGELLEEEVLIPLYF